MKKKKTTTPVDDLTWLYPADDTRAIELHRILSKETKLTLIIWIIWLVPYLFLNHKEFLEGLECCRYKGKLAELEKREQDCFRKIKTLKALKDTNSSQARQIALNLNKEIKKILRNRKELTQKIDRKGANEKTKNGK